MLPVLTLHKPFFAEITVPTFLLHIFMVIDKVIQKERSILYEVTSVIVREKNVRMNVYLIVIGYRDRAV